MSVILNKPDDLSMLLAHMVDGQIAEVTLWDNTRAHEYIGRIVQRYGQSLITVGEVKGRSWPEIFSSAATDFKKDQFRVRALQSGETLTIQ